MNINRLRWNFYNCQAKSNATAAGNKPIVDTTVSSSEIHFKQKMPHTKSHRQTICVLFVHSEKAALTSSWSLEGLGD